MVMLRSSVVALAIVVSVAAVNPIRQAFSTSESDLVKKAYFAGEPGTQLAAYSEAIEKSPDSYMSYYRRGVLLTHQGKYEPALADLDKAVRLSPAVKSSEELGIRAWNTLLPETHAMQMVVLVHAARADVLSELNRPKDAIADLNAAIALDPRRAVLRHRRGLLHMEAGDAPAAIADFDALLERSENVNWRFARGMSHYVNGDLAKAEADFIRATKLDPNNAIYARWLAKTSKKRGIPI